MSENIILNEFDSLKSNFVKQELDRVYQQIYTDVCNVQPELMARTITSRESSAINSFYLHLEKKIRQTAITGMQKSGVSEENTSLIWARVRQKVKTPQPKLCNQGSYRNNPEPHIADTVAGDLTSCPPSNDKWIGFTAIAAGVVAEIVAWVFIPSYKVWAPIVKGIGIILVGGGAYTLYKEKKVDSRISLTPRAMEQEREKSRSYLRDMCQEQFKLNYQIYCKWIDELCSAVINECNIAR